MKLGTYAFAQLLRVLPRERITRAVGRLCDLQLHPTISRIAVGAYTRAYDVNLDEAEPLNGQGAYRSFDEFFTRALRPGLRPIAAPANALVSPADGRLDATGKVSESGVIMVKGKPYRSAELLGCDEASERYRGGPFAVVYLSPRDYHRVHAPSGGQITEVRSMRGDLFPVNSVSEQHIPRFLSLNRRVAIQMKCDGQPEVTVVMVAAMIVGRITVTGIDAPDVPYGIHTPRCDLERGDELSVFHLGSTAVIFAEPPSAEFDRPHGPIQLGEPLQHGVSG